MSDENLNEMELSVQDANTLVDESKELLKSLYNVENHYERRMITQDELRNDISLFVASQLKNLENQNTLKGLLEAEIAKRVLTHELSNDELRSFYSTISSEKAKNILGWNPAKTNIEQIIKDAWNWHSNHPNGYED